VILVDSSVWIDYFSECATAQSEILDRLLGTEQLLTGDLILVEVLQGFRAEADFRRALDLLGGLEFLPLAGREIAIRAARNYRTLRRKGITVRKTIDGLIATFCITNGHLLLHSDRDYDGFERYLGLQVVKAHPALPPALA
jgi:predicted nucleic acid-binding protein